MNTTVRKWQMMYKTLSTSTRPENKNRPIYSELYSTFSARLFNDIENLTWIVLETIAVVWRRENIVQNLACHFLNKTELTESLI